MSHANTGVAPAWRDAMNLPGSSSMAGLKALFSSIDWWRLDPYPELLTFQPGLERLAGFIAAGRSTDRDLAMLYLLEGGVAQIRKELVRSGLVALCFDPANASLLWSRPVEGRDNEDGPSFIEMRSSTSLNGVTIYYPEQKVDDIRPYPWTVHIRASPRDSGGVSFDSTISNVTLINSYNGIRTGATENGRHRILGVHGNVRLVNCGFWGPVEHNAVLRGRRIHIVLGLLLL
jgi:hypothetical protein